MTDDRRNRNERERDNRTEMKRDEAAGREGKKRGRVNGYDLGMIGILILPMLIAMLFYVFVPDKTFSERENRNLTTRPKVTTEGVLSGSFEKKAEKYVADQFVARNFWVRTHSIASRLLGRDMSGGVYRGKKGYLIQRFDEPDQNLMAEQTEAMKGFAARHSDARHYVLIAPTACEILKDKLPANAPAADEAAYISKYYEMLGAAQSTAESSMQSTAEGAAQSTVEDTTQSTTENTTQEAAESSMQSAAEGAAQSTVEDTTQSTTENTTQEAVESSMQSATEDTTQSTTENTTQEAAESSMQSAAEDTTQIRGIDVVEAMRSHSAEYLYYKTDHHWTTQGAHIAYREFASEAGVDSADSFRDLLVSKDFQGTLVGMSGYGTRTRDEIYVSIPTQSDFAASVLYVEEQEKLPTMFREEALASSNQYEVFLGGNHPLIKINTTNLSGRRLLVFKDSYANCFIPFLAPQFESVIVVDPRYYYEDIDALTQQEKITDVLYLYNADTLSKDRSLATVLRNE